MNTSLVLYFSSDLEKHHLKYVLRFPVVTVLGKYETDGRILLLPVKGNGNINITDGESLIFQSCLHTNVKMYYTNVQLSATEGSQLVTNFLHFTSVYMLKMLLNPVTAL
jgi:hypothetical protein